MSGALVDFDQVRGKPTVEDSADVIIIGTGAAGATVARVLTAAGVETILIEEGPSVPTAELDRNVFTGMKRVWRDFGTQVAQGRAFIPVLQGRCVGGSTAINSAIIHRMPEKIHAIWCREHGAADALPYAELSRAWDLLDRELSVGETPANALGENARLLLEGARTLGLRANAIKRSVKDCQGSARCLQGCPTARRQSMNVSFVPESIARGARLYTNCRATKITQRGGRAAGAWGRFFGPRGERGPALHVRARRAVVVAASTIQTPLLLAASGIGKRSGLVGRRFQAHPGTGIAGIFDKPVEIWRGSTQGAESMHFWEDRFKLESISLPPELGALRLPGVGDELLRELGRWGNVAIWAVQVRARAHGTVKRSLFGSTKISYDLLDDDVALLKRGVRVLCDMMFAAGAREVLPGIHGLPDRLKSPDESRLVEALPNDPRLFHCIATHLFGTATLGMNPSTSVVAPTGESHELPGLYVADSSIFPTNLGVNPQHTICGIAWLLGERLANAQGNRARAAAYQGAT